MSCLIGSGGIGPGLTGGWCEMTGFSQPCARPVSRRPFLENLGYQLGLIGFPSVGSVCRIAHYAVFVHPRYWHRGILVLLTSLLSVPFRLLETIVYGQRIRAVEVRAPVFVIGHWRSGTTHLHNLLSQDPSLGYVTMYQAMVPGLSLVGERWIKPWLARAVPQKRPMDEVRWPVDAPQEEEIPLAKITPYSLYVRFLFPRKALALFRRHVLLRGAPESVRRELRRKYIRLLQVATLHADGRRLVLKNPVNTARVAFLLALFPDAKFIHIRRSPWDVFASTRHMHQKMLPITTLQTVPEQPADEAILALYADMMQCYLAERELIPEGNLVEVAYEALEVNPVSELARIYAALALDGFDRLQPRLRAYVANQRGYQKNRHQLSRADRRRVEAHWGFAIDALGYGDQR